MNEDRERDFIERQTDRDISRRRLMEWMAKVGFGTSTAGFLAASALNGCGGKKGIGGGGDGGGGSFGEGKDTIKIGVIGSFSGIGSFIGAIVDRAIDATKAHVNATGGIGGRKIEFIKKDISAADPNQVTKAYQDLAGIQDIAGVVWGIPGGVRELKDRIVVDQILLSGAFAGLYDDGDLYPDNEAFRPFFQFLIPDTWATEVLADYSKNNRGYARGGIIYDSTLFDVAKARIQNAFRNVGIDGSKVASYTLNNSNFGSQIGAVKGSQTVWMWGLATDTANAVKQLADSGMAYVDVNSARAGTGPQLMGSPASLGEKKWAELAGAAAKAGTLTAWHVGGLIYLPSFKFRAWAKKYLDTFPTGGEESPADASYLVANAVKRAGSLDRKKMIEAVESAGRQTFSSIDFEFTKKSHLSKTKDDLIIVTLERGKPANGTYKLGKEFKEVFPAGYVGPTHLVNPTVEANKRRHPDVMKEVIEGGWGTQCALDNPIH